MKLLKETAENRAKKKKTGIKNEDMVWVYFSPNWSVAQT